MTNHVVGVTSGQFAHEGHGNEADRHHDVTARRRSTIKAEADPPSQMAMWCSGMAGRFLDILNVLLFFLQIFTRDDR